MASKHLREARPKYCQEEKRVQRWTPPAFRAAKLTPVLGVFATCIIAGLPGAGLSLALTELASLAQVGSSVASCRPYILSAGSCLELSRKSFLDLPSKARPYSWRSWAFIFWEVAPPGRPPN